MGSNSDKESPSKTANGLLLQLAIRFWTDSMAARASSCESRAQKLPKRLLPNSCVGPPCTMQQLPSRITTEIAPEASRDCRNSSSN